MSNVLDQLNICLKTMLLVLLTLLVFPSAQAGYFVKADTSQTAISMSSSATSQCELQVATIAIAPTESNDDDMWRKGHLDADRYYHGYYTGKWATFAVSFLTGGIVGLIPALAISLTPPKRANLGYPDESLMKNDEYRTAYLKEAKRIKSRKVWGGYGLGVAAVVVFIILLRAVL